MTSLSDHIETTGKTFLLVAVMINIGKVPPDRILVYKSVFAFNTQRAELICNYV